MDGTRRGEMNDKQTIRCLRRGNEVMTSWYEPKV